MWQAEKMPHSCAAWKCTNRFTVQTKSQGITFHRFPKDTSRRKQWEVALRREGFSASSSSMLCSEHFKPEDFDRTGQTVRIRDGAVPSVFSFPAHPQRPAATRTAEPSKKVLKEETLAADCSQLVQDTDEPLPDHSYVLPSSPDDLRARLSDALARVESLEREKRNAKDRERRAKNTVNRQNSVEDYFHKKNSTPCTPQEAAVLTESILSVIVKNMRPLAVVEGVDFQEMLATFRTGYTLPSRRHFTSMMEEKYETTVERLKNKLKDSTSKITLTTDAWTSVATEAYLGVTCHFINDNWELTSYNLTTMPIEERHTAENIASWVEGVAEKFDFSLENVLAIVHDNAQNIVAAVRILEEKHGVASIRCAGHTFQLVVNHTMKEPVIDKALSAAWCLVQHFKKNDVLKLQLQIQALALDIKREQQQSRLQQATAGQEASANPLPKTRSSSVLDTLLEGSNEEDTGLEDDGDSDTVRNEVLLYFGENYPKG
ncbi:hypothetical protein ABVT39_022228 [Epinephelus coioides]